MKRKKKDYSMSMRVGDGPYIPVDPDVLDEGAAHGLNRIEQWKILERIVRDRKTIRDEKAIKNEQFNSMLKKLDDQEDGALAALDERNAQLTMPLEEKPADGE